MSKLSKNLLTMLDQWHAKPSRNHRAWVEGDEGKIYARLTKRVVDGAMVPTVDLATIEIDEDHRGQGVFSALLNKVEQWASHRGCCVLVESIQEPRLADFLDRQGYVILGPEDIPSMVKTPHAMQTAYDVLAWSNRQSTTSSHQWLATIKQHIHDHHVPNTTIQAWINHGARHWAHAWEDLAVAVFFDLIQAERYILAQSHVRRHGIDLNARQAPLHHSALDLAIKQSDPDNPNKMLHQPAGENGNAIDMIAWLLNHGADPKGDPRPYDTTWRPLQQAMLVSSAAQVIPMLLEAGASWSDSFDTDSSIARWFSQKMPMTPKAWLEAWPLLKSQSFQEWEELEQALRQRDHLRQEVGANQLPRERRKI